MRLHRALRSLAFFSLIAIWACDTTEGLRFRNQIEWRTFDSGSYEVSISGGAYRDTAPEVMNTFNCPGGGTSQSGETAVLQVNATVQTPLLEITTPFGESCDAVEPIGVELYGLPWGTLDVYENCDSSASERYVNRCVGRGGFPGYFFDDCTEASAADDLDPRLPRCVLIQEGDFKLVAQSRYLDQPECLSAERSEYSSTSIEACDACDAFEPTEITVAFRGGLVDAEGCCDEDAEPSYAFCLRSCACREVSYQLVPKEEEVAHELKIAVVSDVEGNASTLKRFVTMALEAEVDLVIHIGDLTEGGGSGAITSMAELLEELLVDVDGASCPITSDERQCCEEGDREHTVFCETRKPGPLYTSGIGENEVDEETFYTFFEHFGASNSSALIGRVQMVMLDSADATIANAQFDWLEEVMPWPKPEEETCDLGQLPSGLDQWPLLGDIACEEGCDSCLFGTPGSSLSQCITPAEGRSDTADGPYNCMCIPAQASPCPGSYSCLADEGEGICGCVRDGDCGPGFTCVEGLCQPPMRLFFTHTPPFDIVGARNSAFLSRRESARLVSTLVNREVDLIFAGSINTFKRVSIGGIPTFITGGGGAEMESFDDVGHHWLLVTIGDAYDAPYLSSIELQEL